MAEEGNEFSTSSWRQNHESFDAATLDTALPGNLSFTYAFLNRYYRVVGHDATDGKPPMHSHVMDLAWKKPDKLTISLYGLLLDYRPPAQYSLSTQTFGCERPAPGKSIRSGACFMPRSSQTSGTSASIRTMSTSTTAWPSWGRRGTA